MFTNELWNKPAASATGLYGFQIENSCRFDSGSSSYLYRDNGGSTSTGTEFTISCWIKRTVLSDASKGYIWGNGSGWNYGYFDAGDKLQTDTHKTHETTAVYRDTGGFYHIVWNVQSLDTSYLWVNGVAQTVNVSGSGTFHTPFYPNTNFYVGRSGANYFDGYLAEYHALYDVNADQDDFGEFKNGVWIPKEYTGSYGSAGFYLKFEDASNLGNDSSGNNNDLTASGLGTDHQTIDTPVNGTGD
jgi:hypothetical protein